MSMSKPIIRNGKVGRPRKITVEDVKKAIAKYQTTSIYILAEKLNTSHMTIHRRMENISEEEIEQILQELTEEQLKPYEMEYEVFKMLPEMQEFIKTLKAQEVSKKHRKNATRIVFKVCKYLKLRPKALTIDRLKELRDLFLKVKEGKIKMGQASQSLFNYMRIWYLYSVGISKELLNKHGMVYQTSPIGRYAREKIPMELREAFPKALHDTLKEKGEENEYPTYLSLTYWLFHTGTRINASLNESIEDITWYDTYGMAKVIDKGRHKLGRAKWDKVIIGELEKAIKYNLECRGYTKIGKLFPLEYEKTRRVFREAYKRIDYHCKSPMHIWRHTASQELLDATGWNYDLVAAILGWKDTRTLKACYGEMGDAVKLKTLQKAMGLPVKEEKKEFKFSNKPIETFFF